AVDRAVGVAFDVDDLAVADADELGAADGTVRADAGHFLRAGELESAGLLLGGPQVEAQAEQAAQGEAAAERGAKEVAAIEGSVRHDILPSRAVPNCSCCYSTAGRRRRPLE